MGSRNIFDPTEPAEFSIEELSPNRGEILRSGKGRQVPCHSQMDGSLDPAKEQGLRRAARSKFLGNINFRMWPPIFEVENRLKGTTKSTER
jgi:hypothetical protein